MNSHKCKKPFLCSCEVDELAEKTSDRMMEIVKEHFKTKEQMTAKEIAEKASSVKSKFDIDTVEGATAYLESEGVNVEECVKMGRKVIKQIKTLT